MANSRMPTEPKKGYTPIVLVSMEKEKEGREYLLPSKSHILLVWCVTVLTVFVVMFRWPWGEVGIKMIFLYSSEEQ